MEKFFDSLDPAKLLQKLEKLEFPPTELLMHCMVHWAPTALMNNECASEVVQVTRSILAGSEASTSMARGYLYELCELVSKEAPRTTLGTHVDDFIFTTNNCQEFEAWFAEVRKELNISSMNRMGMNGVDYMSDRIFS